MKKLSLFFLLAFFYSFSFSQNYQWAFKIGGGIDDAGKVVYTDSNGYAYVSGYFKGSNVDFDPGAGTALMSSSGDKEAFVAKYTIGGQYVWAFKIGGANLDEAAVTADGAGNVYVTGYFRGANVDFDPGAGTALLTSNGEMGGDPGYGGDMFLAKYNSSGQYQWAFNVGGTSLGDNGMVLATDNANNVYVGGYFRESPDFNPGAGVATLSAASGTMFIAKYNTNGQYQWAFNLGLGNVDNAPFGMKVDAAGNVYSTGFFQGVDQDFNPGAGTAPLSSNGNLEVFVAKYNTNGQYQWAFAIGGSGADVGRDIEIDNLGNVYVAGDFEGTNIDFNPSPSAAALLTANNHDVFIAKYNSAGQYQWAKRFGAGGYDISWSLTFANNHLFITGNFQNTINFDPAGVDNIVSKGGNDIYVTKFDVNGNYVCAFGIGGTLNDEAYKIDSDGSGSLYVTGILSSANTDFNPSTSVVNNLSSSGSSDVFVAKYTWPENTLPNGSLSGNTIGCGGGQGQLTFTATAGNGPFTVQYGVGSNVYTQANVQSGVPFNVSVNPASTTTYSLVSIKGSEKCPSVNYPSGQTATITVGSGLSPDFAYAQDVCNPLTVQFSNLTPNATSFSWDFGNATTNTGNPVPSVTYAGYGTYEVKLRVAAANGCADSVVKLIPVNVTQSTLITQSDTTICRGTSVQLNTIPSIDFCWGSQPGLSSTSITNPVATPVNNTTYYFTSKTISNNLVVNGDFSTGNNGFTSDYTPQFPNTTEAVYWIGNNPNAWNAAFSSCTEHTTGTGNMMMVNGSPVTGAKVWSQSVTVSPNTNYAFSVWVQSLAAMNPANLRFSINGNALGNNITAGSTACAWSRFYATWNSGNNTSATITIVNNNTIVTGNDFAIDDISFAEVILRQDSVRITVTDPPDITVPGNTSICPGDNITLGAAGATVYSWSPAAGLSNPNTSNPVASPMVTTKYIVTGYDLPGCVGKDSVTVTVKDTPVISMISDTSFCKGSSPVTLFASAPNATQYTWSPATGLSNPNTSNPVANPPGSQTYYLEVLANNGCKSRDSVRVQVLDPPTIDVRPDTSICSGTQLLLNTTGNGATSYSWSPATGLSDPYMANPLASPLAATKYVLTVSNGACSAKDSLMLDVKPAPNVTTSNDTTICNGGQAQLFATGGINYNWSPVTGLSNSNISNPVASPNAPTKYFVAVTGTNGCSKVDSVNIGWQPKPVFSIAPSAIAICEGDSTTLTANGADVYNWISGTNIMSPNNAATIVFPGNTQQFSVAVQHNFCKVSDTLFATVTVNEPPTAAASKSNDIDCSNATAQLAATGGVSYQWYPQTAITSPNSATPTVSPLVSTTYYVQVTNAQGCSDIDSVRVNVLFNPTEGGYNMPNAFTPNNDGKNDCFGLKYWGVVQELEFTVFNRWGERVFQTSNASVCWDGTHKGLPQATGTYVYQVKAKTACGSVYKKGTVILMR